jgi:glutamyl-tRNA synthetase
LIPSYFSSKPSDYIIDVFELVRDRCSDIDDLIKNSSFFFTAPDILGAIAIKPKWNDDKKNFFLAYIEKLQSSIEWNATNLENSFKGLAIEKNIKPGELQFPFRLMLVGGKFGPPVFDIANLLGKEETIKRIEFALNIFNN